MSRPARKRKPRFRLPGKFQGSGVVMTVRSRDGLKIVNGQPAQGGRPPIGGLHQFGSRTKSIYANAEDGNPFADYQLVQIEDCVRSTEKYLNDVAGELERLEGALPELELAPPAAPDPTTFRISLGRYGTTAARLILQADGLLVRISGLLYHQFINQQQARSLRARLRNAVRRLLAQGADYRAAACTRHDLLACNQAARQAIDLLIESGFIDARMFAGFEDICRTYAAYDVAPEFGPPVNRQARAGQAEDESAEASDAAEHGATPKPGEEGKETGAGSSPGNRQETVAGSTDGKETGADPDNGKETAARRTAGADAEAVADGDPAAGEDLGQ